MLKFLPAFIFSIFLALFCLFVAPEVSEAACANVPLSDNYEVISNCAFSGDVNGVETGNLIIAENQTLTINGGQVIVFNPGQRVTVNGRLAIAKDGRLSVSHIWYLDADNDNFPDNLNATSSRESPGSNYYRRSDSRFTTSYSACGVTTVDGISCGGGRYLDVSENCIETVANRYSPDCDNLDYPCDVCKTSGPGAKICSDRGGGTQPTGCTGCYFCNGSGVCVLCRWTHVSTTYYRWVSGTAVACNWTNRTLTRYKTSTMTSACTNTGQPTLSSYPYTHAYGYRCDCN